jgi:ribose 5-phosphate isomerase B
MKRLVVTERDIRDALARGCKRLEIPENAILTPLAADTAAEKHVEIVRSAPSPVGGQKVVVAIGSDHGGFELKTQLAEHIRAQGFQVEDAGTTSKDPCDYPDFAYAVGRLVAAGKAGLGIMIDGAGIGSCMVVNKIPGIRGACCTNELMARNAREHNDANVLTLGSRVVELEAAKGVVDAFLRMSFAGGRHEGRVRKIMDVDEKYRRP